ncbi:MAG: ABC transporter substrate-binding protein [Chloroflexi bacterium]|nr:ABC transporter substrate-binding protein [Chloroflexota bacterium]
MWGVSGLAPEAGIYIAKERGYFQAQGLDVDLQVFRSFTDQIGLLGTGKLDYGTGGLNVDLFNAVQRGIPLKIVVANAVGTKGDASSALLVRQDLVDSGRYKDFKDLKGMSIAENSSGTSSQMITEKILAMGGLTKADVTFPTVSFPDMATAFANKAIDAAFDVEPFVNGIVSKHLAKSVIAVGDAFPNSVNQVVVISPQFAQQQPEAARRIMVAFLKGQREYYAAFLGNTNPGDRDAIIQILTKYTALKDPKLYQGMGMSGADPNGDGVDLKIVGEFQDYFIKAGTEKQPIDPAQLVDPSYMNYAVQKLGKV